MSMKETTYGAVKEIRIASEVAVEFPCIVGNTGISAVDGKKIIKAGTPIGAGSAISASTDVLRNRQVVLQQDTANAQGVILHDTDVTDGNANATIMVSGYVDYLKLDESVRTLVDTAYGEFNNANANLKFVKGRE